MVSKLVVDSSVAVKWSVDEPFTAEADRLLTVAQNGTLELIAPDFIVVEVGNVLWKKQRSGDVEMQEALNALHDFQTLELRLVPASELLEQAYRLAVTHQRTFYDSLYLALSVREGCPFVTADEKLVNAVQSALPQVMTLSQWVQQSTP